MFDDIHAYFHENVLSSYLDYKKRRNEHNVGRNVDLKKALIAANSLYHFREHLPSKYKKKREEFALLCEDYDLLGDVVNVSKHNKLTQKWKYINSTDSIEEILVITKYVDSKGEYFNSEKNINVRIIDGTKRDLFNILTNVLNMWYSYLHDIGILKEKYIEKIVEPIYPLKRNQSSGNNFSITATRGVRFNQHVQLQEFNYETGKIEPVNLEGAKAQMRVYKPSYEVDLKLIHGETKKEIVIPLKLSDRDMLRIHVLKDEVKLRKYLIKLAIKQKIIKADDPILNSMKVERT